MKALLLIALLLVGCNWSIVSYDPGEPHSGELPPYFAANASFTWNGQEHYMSIRACPDSLIWWTADSDSVRSIAAVARTDSLLRILLPENEYTPNLILNGLTVADEYRVTYHGDVYVAGVPTNLKVGKFLGTFYPWRP